MANEAKGSDFKEIRDWLNQIAVAKKRDHDWREEAKSYYIRYENEKSKNADGSTNTDPGDGAYNLLFSNTEILQPALYSSTPKPDVRRRYRDKDEIGKLAATVMERALDYSISDYPFDDEMGDAVFDLLLAGRGTARVKYDPTFKTKTVDAADGTTKDFEVIDEERSVCEYVPWDKYRILGNARRWNEVTAIVFDHRLTKAELEKKFGEALASAVKMDDLDEDEKAAIDKDTDIESLKTALVHEIWDKDQKRVVFFSPNYKERYLANTPDPLRFKHFWPMPRPMYFVRTTKSLVPVPLTRLYKRQLRELDLTTIRIAKVTDAMRVRGLYPGNITELPAVAQADDNDWIPIENAAALADGDLAKMVWIWPIEKLPLVLQQLYQARDQIKQAIYEIIGISDILRGASKASETLGAQKIKANSGSMRISRAQKEVQRFVRDILRLKAEIIVDRYDEATLAKMTNIELTPSGTKEKAQAVAQMAQQQGQPIPPAAQEGMTTPSWGDVLPILKDDMLRSYKIDIETDSTVADELDRDAEGLAQVIGAVGQVIQGAAPAVQSGLIAPDVVLEIILAIARRARLGSAVEDALEEGRGKMMAPPAAPPAQPGPPQAGQPPGAPPAPQRPQLSAVG